MAKKPTDAAPEQMEQAVAIREEQNGAKARHMIQQGRPVVTPAEYLILERLHGKGAIHLVATGPTKPADYAKERERLSLRYDRDSNRRNRQTPTEALFRGVGKLPLTFAEIEVKRPAAKVDMSPAEPDAKDAEIADLKEKLAAAEKAAAEKAAAEKAAAEKAAAEKAAAEKAAAEKAAAEKAAAEKAGRKTAKTELEDLTG